MSALDEAIQQIKNEKTRNLTEKFLKRLYELCPSLTDPTSFSAREQNIYNFPNFWKISGKEVYVDMKWRAKHCSMHITLVGDVISSSIRDGDDLTVWHNLQKGIPSSFRNYVNVYFQKDEIYPL